MGLKSDWATYLTIPSPVKIRPIMGLKFRTSNHKCKCHGQNQTYNGIEIQLMFNSWNNMVVKIRPIMGLKSPFTDFTETYSGQNQTYNGIEINHKRKLFYSSKGQNQTYNGIEIGAT